MMIFFFVLVIVSGVTMAWLRINKINGAYFKAHPIKP